LKSSPQNLPHCFREFKENSPTAIEMTVQVLTLMFVIALVMLVLELLNATKK
jgi:hypothetical protein